jgi:hypothetical protein
MDMILFFDVHGVHNGLNDCDVHGIHDVLDDTGFHVDLNDSDVHGVSDDLAVCDIRCVAMACGL